MVGPNALAIYIHWPYCARICPYCDFNVFKGRENSDLVAAIISDLSHWRARSGPRNITSVHFGGGTPSLLPAKDVERIIHHVGSLWTLENDVEIAIEANPNDSDTEKWRDLKEAGVSRLSLGVQSFNPDALTLLGRDHTALEAERALETALNIFPSVSLDLIFGWQGQDEGMLRSDLNTAIKSDVPHISAYQLTIEEGTAFAKAEARGQKKSVDDDMSADFYDLTQSCLTESGYTHYEVSNYAKPRHRSRHNLTYWKGGDYVGVGPGAHGRLTLGPHRYETTTKLSPAGYIQAVADTGSGIDVYAPLSPAAWAQEYVLMGLRISEGISGSRFKELSGHTLSRETLAELSDAGLIKCDGDRISATPEGRLVLNGLTEKLLETI